MGCVGHEGVCEGVKDKVGFQVRHILGCRSFCHSSDLLRDRTGTAAINLMAWIIYQRIHEVAFSDACRPAVFSRLKTWTGTDRCSSDDLAVTMISSI